jgi:uncharacterized protein (TIGR02217 family)
MAFYEAPRFPESVSFGAQGGPEFLTDIVRTNAREYGIGRRSFPLQRWDVSPGIRTQDDYGELLAFFMAMRGRLHRFRFRDPIDNTEAHGKGSGVVTGITSTTFQLVKRYTAAAGVTLDRPIRKPVLGTIEILESGVPLAVSAWSMAYATGIVTISSAPTAANITWRGSFDVPARFDIDHLPATTVARQPTGLIVQSQGIAVIEVPL